MEPLLTIENLCVDFISNSIASHALHNISLTVNKGEVVAIVGESGSGKSVTSLSIMRLIPNPPGKIIGGQINYYRDGNNPVDLVKLMGAL